MKLPLPLGLGLPASSFGSPVTSELLDHCLSGKDHRERLRKQPGRSLGGTGLGGKKHGYTLRAPGGARVEVRASAQESPGGGGGVGEAGRMGCSPIPVPELSSLGGPMPSLT